MSEEKENDDLIFEADRAVKENNYPRAIALALIDIANSQRILIDLEVNSQKAAQMANAQLSHLMKRQVDVLAPEESDDSITGITAGALTPEEIETLTAIDAATKDKP